MSFRADWARNGDADWLFTLADQGGKAVKSARPAFPTRGSGADAPDALKGAVVLGNKKTRGCMSILPFFVV